jgi:cell shape-determining protein MreD
MASTAHTHHHYPLHERITRVVGADVRLLYGIGVPILATVGFIIALAVSKQTWMAGAVVFFLVITLAVVVFGLYGMLDDEDENERRS